MDDVLRGALRLLRADWARFPAFLDALFEQCDLHGAIDFKEQVDAKVSRLRQSVQGKCAHASRRSKPNLGYEQLTPMVECPDCTLVWLSEPGRLELPTTRVTIPLVARPLQVSCGYLSQDGGRCSLTSDHQGACES